MQLILAKLLAYSKKGQPSSYLFNYRESKQPLNEYMENVGNLEDFFSDPEYEIHIQRIWRRCKVNCKHCSIAKISKT